MTGKPAGSGRIAALAGARAFPPLMVVMFHFSEGHHYSGWRVLDYLATRGGHLAKRPADYDPA